MTLSAVWKHLIYCIIPHSLHTNDGENKTGYENAPISVLRLSDSLFLFLLQNLMAGKSAEIFILELQNFYTQSFLCLRFGTFDYRYYPFF
jgi:hypothetical protein